VKIWKLVDSVTSVTAITDLTAAAHILRDGGLVAFPTETVYGLGGNAYSEVAVQRIFTAKGRPSDNPVIVHIADIEQLAQVTPDPKALNLPLQRAIKAFWPGPLTVIMPAHPNLANSVHPGLETVAVRCPSHPVARALIRLADCPIAAPSANTSGKPSPTRYEDVLEDMSDKIDGLLDGGPCQVGLESTVVEITATGAMIYRPGAITANQLQSVLQVPVSFDKHLLGEGTPKSPGMKYRHYAPNAEVQVFLGESNAVTRVMKMFVKEHSGQCIGIISPHPIEGLSEDMQWSVQPSVSYVNMLSRELYRLLRMFDRQGAAFILVSGVPPEGLGMAVMNRLEKAAEGRVYDV